MEGDEQKLNLKRDVGIIGAVSFIAGTMIGSGIFMSPQYVLSTIGSPGASLIIWACCGVIAMLGGLCYAELGTVIPESGAEYIYILRTAGKVMAFMFVFSFIIVMRPASATGIALSFAEYIVAPFYNNCTPPQLVVKCVAAGVIMVLAIVNCLSVRLATGIQVVSMVVKVLALAVIILGGVVMLFQGHTENFDNSFEGTNVGVNTIGIAFYQGLWSYDGWNTLNYLTEELKHPEGGGVAIISGTMIGSGIFMSPQFILSYVGSPGASLVIWALSGVVSMFAALSYTELGTIFSESGGEFIYILRIYGSCPAFFTAFTFILVMKPFGVAGNAFSIAEYIVALYYSDCHPPQLVLKCAAAAAILLTATINILNVRIAIRIQVIFLVAKVLTLTLIVIGGIVELIQSSSVIVENLNPGASLIIWACCGVIAMLGGLCYAELGTVIPESGAEYIYILRTAGKVMAFVFVFSFIIVMRPASATGIALSFAEYIVAPFYNNCGPPQLVVKCVAAGVIMVLARVNCLSVRLATGIQVVSMVVKVLALAVIILGAMADKQPEALKLKREIGLIGGVAIISGTMIGSGIFMSPQFILSYVGSPGASLVIWALSGVVSMFAALSYTELGTIFSESGGEFIYILRIYGSCPAFFTAFTFILVMKPFGVAGNAFSIAEYIVAPFYSDCHPPQLVLKCAAAAAILLTATINILNVRIAIRIQVIFLVAKVLTLTLIIIGGIVELIQNSSVIVENLKVENSFKGTQYSLSNLGMAFYQGLWSFAGWYNLNYVTEELKRPEVRLSMLGGLCYAELGTVIPESGAEYIYILRTAGKVMAFVFVFSFIIVMRPASATGIALSFAEYIVAPFYNNCGPPQLVVKCVAAGVIMVLARVNCLSVRLATGIQVVSMVVKVLALAVIILGGVVMLFQGHTENFDNSFEGTNVGVNTIGIAFYQGLWSYDGWNTLNYLTEELKHPEFILSYVGSPGASLVIWALSGVVSMFAALSYTELGTIFSESGGEFIYILRIYGSCPAFFTAFTFILVMKPFGVAGNAFSIAEYIVAPFYSDCHPPQLVLKCAAAAAILLTATINILNVRIAIRIQVIFLVAKVLTLTLIVIGGIVELIQNSSVIVENLKVENSFKGTQYSLSNLGMAFYQGLWSFAGWYNLNYVTEELKRPEYVLSTIGSPGASLIIWACCGVIAMLGGLCYAELGTVIPESGAEYIYILRTAGKVMAFVFVFSFIIVMRPASATGIALSFAEYIVAPFYNNCGPPQLVVKCVAAGVIMVLAIVNCLSVRLATGIQVVSMVVKVLALAVIILGGVVMLFQGHTENFDNSFEGTNVGVNTIGIAFYQGLWSYDGWNTLNYLTEELKHPELILNDVGSPGASLVIWALTGVVSMFAALSYIELGTIFSESGGDFIYTLRIYGSCPAFFTAFTFILVMKPFGVAAGAFSIAQYIVAPFYSDCHPPQLVLKCAAAAAILLTATINILNVRIAIRIQVIFLVAKVLTLTLIVIGGIVELIQNSSVIVENLKVENSFKGTQYSLSTLGMAFYQGLWSFAGWSSLNCVTEELKRPEVNLPRAVVIAISLVTGLYLLVNVSYLTVMTPKELMSSSAVAVTWGNKVLGSWGWIMSLAAALSAFGSLNGTFFSGGRVCFVAAREGHMPDILAMAHVHRLTPSPALIFTTIVSLVVLIPGDFQSIVNYFSFTAWFFYAITLSGLLYLKIKKPDLPRSYRVPIILPILVLIAAVFLVLAPIVDNPQIEYLYVSLFILSGAIIYVPFIHYKLCPGLLTKLTVFLQLFLEVAPAEKNL
ncbi:hypothetical protein L3Q82_026771 [Scortum barcoo]|uniref:Uncharacterized protein n=1 Tax=Scortum barcoo TaxID=214431 RepID=A0ACB8WKG3_9TELE|nr:hypothetical protein L3Q82_026771 [Scortum barcoo]